MENDKREIWGLKASHGGGGKSEKGKRFYSKWVSLVGAEGKKTGEETATDSTDPWEKRYGEENSRALRKEKPMLAMKGQRYRHKRRK